jgi:alpha-L-fucosidase
MKSFKLYILLITIFTNVFAQVVEYDWFTKTKFGVKINWGVYSVPAWVPENMDVRQYQLALEKLKNPNVIEYHKKMYGTHFSYYNFADQFKGELFQSDEWIELLKKSGANYVVFSAKSNDGFCLWPNEQANDRGFPWNSATLSAKRDFVGEFTNAIRKTNLKFGLSYSVEEPFHTLFQNDKQKYYKDHIDPQLQDLVMTYQPDIIELENNNSASIDISLQEFKKVKPDAVINLKNDLKNKVVDIGITPALGYNKNDAFNRYLTAKDIILILADLASRGNKMLLNIGVDASGIIPPITQERLFQIGKWLEINGEAIYDTESYKKSCQWTLGKIDSASYFNPIDILKNIKSLDRSEATKEILFTQKDSHLYAICPQYPGEELIIKDVVLPDNGFVYFFATQQKPDWYNKNGNLHIKTPKFAPTILNNEMTYAYVFKLANAVVEKASQIILDTSIVTIDSTIVGKNPTLDSTKIESSSHPSNVIEEPKIAVTYASINAKPSVVIENFNDVPVFFTLDGSLPDTSSFTYKGAFAIQQSARLKVLLKNYYNGQDYFIEKYIKVIDEYKNFRLVYPPHKMYSGKGAITLCDGIFGDENYKSEEWLGFHGKDLVAEIELPTERLISSLTISALNYQNENILFPTEFEIYTSLDNENFEYVQKLDILASDKKIAQRKFILEIPLQKAKSIRVFVKNYGELPEKKDGQPQYAWLFIDEIEVR